MTLVNPAIDLDAVGFAEGFLDTPNPETLAIGATPDARNELLIRIQRPEDGGVLASLRKRLGARLLNVTTMAAGKSVDGLVSWDRETAATELLAVCDGTVKRWNGIDDFVAVTGGTGFAANAKTTTLAFRGNLFFMDGHQQKRYDGTDCKEVGQIAPTSAPVLTAGPATLPGAGPTGTYEGFYVWYDPAIDHESSPSDTSNALAITDHQRRWTIVAGAPAANYTHWRVYVRRTDTSEVRFFRAGTVPVAQVIFDEGISDAARRDLGPLPFENDVPPVFAFAEEFKGYRLGFKFESSDMYVSKHLDPESQHPKDVIPIGGKGDMKGARSCKKFGVECLVRKPTRTWRLEGDRMPFKPIQIEGSLGGVSAKSGVEVESWWYDYDEVKGPYRTNTVQWQPLADDKVMGVLATVNKQALHRIEVVHHKTLSIIEWFVPVGGSTRCRLILKWHYGLGRWLAPDTGFEYTAFAEYTTPAGDYGVHYGDEWGRVYQQYNSERDGVPSGDVAGVITAATASTVTCGVAAFFTTGSGLAGIPAVVVSPAGAQQWVRIASNTGTVLTLDVVNGPSLGPVPSGAGWTVAVGAIDWYHHTPWLTAGNPFVGKSTGWFYIYATLSAAAHVLSVALRINRSAAYLATYSFTFPSTGLVWGSGLWGDVWGSGGTPDGRKHRVPQSWRAIQFRFSNYFPDQPVEIGRFRVTGDWLRRRQVKSG